MRVAKPSAYEELPARMAALEDQAFQEFAEAFGPRFRIYFIKRGLSVGDAEDLSISCITDIALKASKYKLLEGGCFEAWVFTIARHALTDWRKKQRPTVPLDEAHASAPLENRWDEELEPIVETNLAVREAIAQLEEVDQAILQLRDLGPRHRYSEIGELLGISSEFARVRRFRALKRLKPILEADPRLDRLIERHKDKKEVVSL